MKRVSQSDKTVKEFIQLVLIENIGGLILSGNHYLGFGPQTQAIELIGAIVEDDAIEKQQSVAESEFETQRKSRRRFYNGIKLFSNQNYILYCPELRSDPTYKKDYDLYDNLRSGYAHQLRPTGNIRVTTELEAINDGNTHLEIDMRTNKLIIVSELLYRDLKEVCEMVISMIENGLINHTKPYSNFLGITKYH